MDFTDIKLHLLNPNGEINQSLTFHNSEAWNKKGGDFMDELLDLPIDEKTEKSKPKKKEIKQKLEFWPQDNIFEFKQKIQLATEIPIYKQHLFIKTNRVVPLRYEVATQNNISVDFLSALERKERMYGLPIDYTMYNYRDQLKIIAKDETTTLENIIIRSNEFYLFNFEDFIEDYRSELVNILETEQINIWYYYCVLKYFPMISQSLLVDIIENNSINNKYPALTKIKDFTIENKILCENLKIRQKKEYKNFIKSQIKIEIQNPVIKKSGSNNINIRLADLFNKYPISSKTPIIRLHTGSRIITKIQENYEIINVFDDLRDLLNPINSSCLLVYVFENSYLLLHVFENGEIQLQGILENNLTLDIIWDKLEKINELIEKINSYNREIYSSTEKINKITRVNSELSQLDVLLTWNRAMGDAEFKAFQEFWEQDRKANLVSFQETNMNKLDILILKGIKNVITEDYFSNNENYYSYLFNAEARENWKNNITSTMVEITRQISEVSIKLNQIHEKTYRSDFNYIMSKIYNFTTLKTQYKTELKINEYNTLKLLKERDPELFDFKKQKTKRVYARICQNQHQPEIYTESEINTYPDLKKKSVKYWNFTNNLPMYYVCPNKNYPNLGFITGMHPKNYCLPCCKVSNPLSTEKKSFIYQECLRTGKSPENTDNEKSRYTMGYGKDIPVGRIGELPEIIKKFLLYNLPTNSKNIVVPELNINVKLLNLENIAKNIKTKSVLFGKLLDLIQEKDKYGNAYANIIENPELNLKLYNYWKSEKIDENPIIYNGDSYHLLNNTETLIKTLVNFVESTKNINSIDRKNRLVPNISLLNTTQINKANKIAENNVDIDYYIIGVKQNLLGLNNIGTLFAISTALDIEPSEFISQCVSKLKNNSDLYKKLLSGTMEFWYSQSEFLDILQDIKFCCVNVNSQIFVKFQYFNEIFIELAKYVFGHKTLIIQDSSLDTTGTNIKFVSTNIEIKIPGNYKKIKYFNKPFIILFSKPSKTTQIIGKNTSYYPIVNLNTVEFFKKGLVKSSVFFTSDPLLALFMQFVIKDIDPETFNLEVVLEFTESSNWNIVKVYITNNKVYYVELEKNKTRVAIPVEYSDPVDLEIPIQELFTRKNNKFSDMLTWIHDYNTWVIEKSRRLNSLRIVGEKSNLMGGDIIPVHLFINPEILLAYKKCCIGWHQNGLNWYFSDTNIKKVSRDFINKNLSDSFKVRSMLYDPDEINKIIHEKPIITDINEIIPKYEKTLNKETYGKWLIQLMEKWDRERNKSIRKNIIQMIKNHNLEKINEFEYSEDIQKIYELYNSFRTHMNIEKTIREIDNYVFQFDRSTLNLINKHLHKIETLDSAEQEIRKQKIRELINKNLDKPIKKDYVEILIADFINPLKRDNLLHGIIYNNLDMMKFYEKPNEKLYFI